MTGKPSNYQYIDRRQEIYNSKWNVRCDNNVNVWKLKSVNNNKSNLKCESKLS